MNNFGVARKSHSIIFFLLLLGCTFVTSAYTHSASTMRWQQTGNATTNGVVVANARVNLRAGPGVAFAVLAKLDPGTQVKIIGINSTRQWVRVRVIPTDASGWLAAEFIQRGDAATATAPQTATPTAQPKSTAPVNTNSVTTNSVTTNPVTTTTAASTDPIAIVQPPKMNIRLGPGTNYPVLTTTSTGTRLSVLALSPDGAWYQVRVDGQEKPGWVLATLTNVSGALDGVNRLNADQVPEAPVAAVSTAPVAVAAASAPPPPPAGAGFFAFGIQAQLWQNDKGGVAAQINDLGFTWVKQQLRWEFVEDAPGNLNWSEPDQVIDVMTGHGIQVLFSVFTAPQWARPDKPGTGGPPNDFNLYADFVGKIAGRYCGRLGAIEVWNEQNLQREWEGFPLDPGMYVDLLRRAYTAIKANCPSVIVVSGAPTPAGTSAVAIDDVEYLRGMYASGLARYSDAIGVHPSGFANPPEVTFEDWQQKRYDAPSHVNHPSFYFRSTMERYRQVMVQAGDTNKRLWPTEFGWASTPSPYPGYEYAGRISDGQQAQYIVTAFRMMRDWGWVGVPFLWNLNFSEGEMAAFHVAGRPAFDALKSLTH